MKKMVMRWSVFQHKYFTAPVSFQLIIGELVTSIVIWVFVNLNYLLYEGADYGIPSDFDRA